MHRVDRVYSVEVLLGMQAANGRCRNVWQESKAVLAKLQVYMVL